MYNADAMRTEQIRTYTNDQLTMLAEAEHLRVKVDPTEAADALNLAQRCRAEIQQRRAAGLPWSR